MLMGTDAPLAGTGNPLVTENLKLNALNLWFHWWSSAWLVHCARVSDNLFTFFFIFECGQD